MPTEKEKRKMKKGEEELGEDCFCRLFPGKYFILEAL